MKAFLIVVAALMSIAAWKKDSCLANMPTNPARYERLEHTVQPRHASPRCRRTLTALTMSICRTRTACIMSFKARRGI